MFPHARPLKGSADIDTCIHTYMHTYIHTYPPTPSAVERVGTNPPFYPPQWGHQKAPRPYPDHAQTMPQTMFQTMPRPCLLRALKPHNFCSIMVSKPPPPDLLRPRVDPPQTSSDHGLTPSPPPKPNNSGSSDHCTFGQNTSVFNVSGGSCSCFA